MTDIITRRGVGDWTFTWITAPEDWRKVFPCAFEACKRTPTSRLTLWRGGIQTMSFLACGDHRDEVEGREREWTYTWSDEFGFGVSL